MNIKCKSTNRFLLKIDTNSLYKQLKIITDLSVEIPIIVEVPCRACRMVEVYEVYKSHYRHIKSYKKER